MRLKKTLNRRVGGTAYHKWLIADLPPTLVAELGWSEGDELVATRRGDYITIRRR
jgi:hypothetical protein